jgi:cell division protein FtsQ
MSPGRVHRGGQPLNTKIVARKRYMLASLATAVIVLIIQQNEEHLVHALSRPVSNVRVEGAQRFVTEEALRNLISPYLGSSFFAFDVSEAKQSLEQHPWIRRVSAKKVWPDALVLDIQEEIAIARWGDGQLINQFGEIFEPPGHQRTAELPLLAGSEGEQHRVMEQYRAVSQQLFSVGLRVTSLSLSQRGNWTLILNDSMSVTLGREKTMERLVRFIELYKSSDLMAFEKLASVDLRYDNGVAVKLAAEDSVELAVR